MTVQSPGLRLGLLFAHSKYRRTFNFHFLWSPALLAPGAALRVGCLDPGYLAATAASCCRIAPASEI